MGGDHLDEGDRPVRAQFPVDGRDEVALEPSLGLGVGHAGEHAGQHGRVLDAHLEVRLGAEEELHVADSAVGAAGQALVGHPPEVVLVLDRPAHQRVDDEEVGQAVVGVQVGDLLVGREFEPVAGGQLREGGCVHCALEMQVQLGFRHRAKCGLGVHGVLPGGSPAAAVLGRSR